jgi:hypothetical protein
VRLGGVDEASIEVGGRTLLDRTVDATVAAQEVVVVGARVPNPRPVTWTRESPPRGGPVAGLLAGVDALSVPPDLVCVLAVDMPRVTPATMARLVEAVRAEEADAAVLVDAQDRQQPLAGVYRDDALSRSGRRSATASTGCRSGGWSGHCGWSACPRWVTRPATSTPRRPHRGPRALTNRAASGKRLRIWRRRRTLGR